MLNYASTPGPSEERGRDGNGDRSLALPSCTPYVSCCPFGPLHSFAVHGAAGHNRGEAVERQPLARTQGRNLDRILIFLRLRRV